MLSQSPFQLLDQLLSTEEKLSVISLKRQEAGEGAAAVVVWWLDSQGQGIESDVQHFPAQVVQFRRCAFSLCTLLLA